jgi:hypothetical protein
VSPPMKCFPITVPQGARDPASLPRLYLLKPHDALHPHLLCHTSLLEAVTSCVLAHSRFSYTTCRVCLLQILVYNPNLTNTVPTESKSHTPSLGPPPRPAVSSPSAGRDLPVKRAAASLCPQSTEDTGKVAHYKGSWKSVVPQIRQSRVTSISMTRDSCNESFSFKVLVYFLKSTLGKYVTYTFLTFFAMVPVTSITVLIPITAPIRI